jgi:hypothetical protein
MGSSEQIGSPAGSEHSGPPSMGLRSLNSAFSVRSLGVSVSANSTQIPSNTSARTAATSLGAAAFVMRPVMASLIET